MFEVEYKGANALVVTVKDTRVVFDSASAGAVSKEVVKSDDIEVLSEGRFASKAHPKLIIDSPGEYEVGDVALIGIPARRHIDTEDQGMQSTLYRMTIGEMRLAFIGNVAPKLSDEQLEALGMVDVVVIPIGGNGYTLDATDAAAMVHQIGPRVVIPVHYADNGVHYEVPQEDTDRFIKELGAPVVEAGVKWKVKNAAAIPEQLSVVKIFCSK